MGKYLWGLLAHLSTSLIIYVLGRIIGIQGFIGGISWLTFLAGIITYMILGNLFYGNLLLNQRIINTVIIIMINTIMGFLIIFGPYGIAFMTLIIYSGVNNAFAPLTYMGGLVERIVSYSIISLIPLLLLMRIPKLRSKTS